jgi:hypothetical protein
MPGIFNLPNERGGVSADQYRQLLAREMARYHGYRDQAVRSANIASGFGNSLAERFMHQAAAAPGAGGGGAGGPGVDTGAVTSAIPTPRPDMGANVPIPTPRPTPGPIVNTVRPELNTLPPYNTVRPEPQTVPFAKNLVRPAPQPLPQQPSQPANAPLPPQPLLNAPIPAPVTPVSDTVRPAPKPQPERQAAPRKKGPFILGKRTRPKYSLPKINLTS